MRTAAIICSIGMIALSLAACGGNTEAAPDSESFAQSAQSTPAEEPAAPAGHVTGAFRIIHVNDIHSYVEAGETAIGYPAIAAYIEQQRAENPNTIVLDGGDSFAGTVSAAFDGGKSIAPILNTIGFDAMVAGNADFSYGKEVLDGFVAALDYPVLAGNMPLLSGEKYLDGTAVIELENGLRVGLVGVTTSECHRFVSDTVAYNNPVDTAKELVAEIRPQVDIVVGLVHLGDAEGSDYTSDMIAEQVEGIDLIVDGHSHTVLETGKIVNDTLITQAGEYSKFIGVIDLEVESGGLASVNAKLITREEMAAAPEKEDTKQAVEALVEQREVFFAQEVGSTSVQLIGTRDIVRTQETNLGNLFTDALREKSGADVAVMPAGIIGGEIDPGVITKGDVLTMARISTDVIVKEMTGADLQVLLDELTSSYPEPSGEFPQVSGMTYQMDPARTEGRIHSIVIGSEAMNPAKIYAVAMPNGMSEDPGAVNGTLAGEFGTTQDALEEYIAAHSPVNPTVEGRITEAPVA